MIRSLSATPDHSTLIFASADGKVWRFDRTLEELYSHGATPNLTTVSADGRLLASCAQDGSLTVFDLNKNRLLAQVFAHAGAFCSVSWVGDELWSAGGEGTIKRWTLDAASLELQHMVQLSGPLRRVKVALGSWVAVIGAGVIVVSHDGASVAVRVDLGGSIDAFDISPDRRYVAASVRGEIVIIDLQRSAIATLEIGAVVQQVQFLEPALLAFSEPAAFKLLRIDKLDYVQFQPMPERVNRVTF